MKLPAWVMTGLGTVIGLAGNGMPSLMAQTPAGPLSSSVIADELVRQLDALASDSLHGRITPSSEIDRTAAYVASQFRRFGVAGQDVDGVIVRYPIPGEQHVDYATSNVELYLSGARSLRGTQFLSEKGSAIPRSTSLSFLTNARILSASLSATLPESASEYPVVLSGRQSLALAGGPDVFGKVVVYVPFAGADSVARQAVLDKLVTTAEGVLVVEDTDAATFDAEVLAARQQVRNFFQDPLQQGTTTRHAWMIAVQGKTIEPWLLGGGFDLARLRTEPAPMVRPVIEGYIFLNITPDTATRVLLTAPNVVGEIFGSDPALAGQAVVISASLDACGGRPDSAAVVPCRHASLAGLLALAAAFGSLKVRPRRSIIFLATSGGPEGGWGSAAFPEGVWGSAAFAEGQPLTTAAVHLDLDGRLLTDTVVVDGSGDVRGVLPPAMLAASRPDLNLTVLDGPTSFETPTEAMAFARIGMPTLVVHPLDEYGRGRGHSLSDSMATSLARLLDFVFAMGQTFSESDAPLQLSPEGRAQLLRAQRLP